MKKVRKFEEELKKLNKDELVYLGFEGGNGWLYIETAEYLLEHLSEIDVVLKNTLQKKTDDAARKSEKLSIDIVSRRFELKTVKDEEEIASLYQVVRRLEQSFINSVNIREKGYKELENWTTLNDREVVDIYEHTVDDPGTSIVLTGDFAGELWFKNEKKIG